MGDVIELDQSPGRRRRGRPPKVNPLEEELPCKVGPKATKRQRQKAFVQEIARTWTFRRACAAAGVSRRKALDWQRTDPDFAEDVIHAQDEYAEAVEEFVLAIFTGRSAGRGERTRLQALQEFLKTNHPAYSRSRLEAAMRNATAMTEYLAEVVKKHVTAAELEAINKDWDAGLRLYQSTGGAKVD